MRMSARGCSKTKAESRKSKGFGRKWNPGDTGIVYYPWYKDPETGTFELLAAMCRGHKADPKSLSLKATFIPSLSQFDDDGNLIGAGDFTYQFSRIAPCFVEGQREAELAKANQKEMSSEAARRQMLLEIEKKYDKDNIKGVKPVIGGLTFVIATECVYVPMKNGEPDIDATELVSQPLSDIRIKQLYALAADPNYEPVKLEGTDIYVQEVQYSWPAGDKAEAGKTSPNGLVPEYRIISKFPQQYRAIRSTLDQLPSESDTIAKRNYQFQKYPENMIKQSLTNYAVMQSEYIDALSGTDNEEMINRIERNASVFEELNLIGNIKNEDILAKINAALELQHAQSDATATVEPTTSSTETEDVPTSAPTIADMLQQEHIGGEDEVASIDLGE